MSQEAEAQVRDRLYASTRTELLERQFANSDAYDKAILTLSSAFLALSLTFIKDILPRGQLAHSWALYASWGVLTLAIVGTVVSFRLSNSAIETQMERAKRYYLERDESAFAKSGISRAVDILNWATGLAFVAGVMLTIGFVTINFPEAKTVADTKQDGSFKGGHTVPTMQKVQVVPVTRGQSVPAMQPVGQGQQSSGQSGSGQQTQSSGQQATTQQTQNPQSTGGSSSTGDGVKWLGGAPRSTGYPNSRCDIVLAARSAMSFKCPICSCPEYQRVVVPRERAEPYATDVLCCLDCSQMFLEPELLSGAPSFTQDVQPRGIDVQDLRLHSDNIRVRFWKARAKRENGGLEPTSEQILKVRDRYRQRAERSLLPSRAQRPQ